MRVSREVASLDRMNGQRMAFGASSCYCELSSRPGLIPVRGMLCLGEAYAL